MRSAVDIMGGDKAPREIVAGCVDASRRLDELPGVEQIVMVGREEAMREELARCKASEDFTCVCVRCGRDFPWTAADGEVAFSLEVEADEFADLTEELRECIILSFPSNPLCSEDCKGLCPHCGADLNKGPCHCRPTEGGDLRWGGLDGLDSGGR